MGTEGQNTSPLIQFEDLSGAELKGAIGSAPRVTQFQPGLGDIGGFLAISALSKETAVPALLARPQHIHSGSVDFRNWQYPTDSLSAQMDRVTPVTGRIEAYGKQVGNQWSYTRRRGEGARYLGGTAPGGFVVLPPEVGMEDKDSSTPFRPSGRVTSITYFAIGPGARLGLGEPDVSTGGIVDGWSAQSLLSTEESEDTAGVIKVDDFVVFKHSDGARAPSLAIGDLTGYLSFRAASSFWGSLTHANTHNRVYTLPDKNGTVAMTSDITAGAPTNASYVVIGADATLTDERVLTAGSGITITDGGAGSTVTIAATVSSSDLFLHERFI